MQMINVLQRLAALDADNPNIANPLAAGHKRVVEADQVAQLPELTEMGDLRALSGLKPLEECGIMPMGGMENRTPASFSINASAADGDEVASMLSQIMNLAGVKPVGDQDMPGIDSHGGHLQQMNAEPAEKDLMRSALDKMNEPGDMIDVEPMGVDDENPEDEGALAGGLGALAGGALGSLVGMPLAGAAIGGGVGAGSFDENENVGATAQAEPGTAEPMQSIADEIRDMAARLSQIEDVGDLPGVDGEEKADESYDNTPNDPTNVPVGNTNDFAYNPNIGGQNKGVYNQPSAMAEDLAGQLFAEYEKFVSESKKKSEVIEGLNHTPGPNIEHRDVEACVKCAETMGVPLTQENMQCLHDSMESFPKFHKHITNKYQECWEDFHARCCDHYHNKNGSTKEDHGIAGVGVLPEERTMSRAAKGVMKYGKNGMQALAKAGKDGKDLDKVRDKYNKYDEGAKPSAGMSKGAKSNLVKKAKSGGDIGKPGKSFDKVARAAGGGEKGKKIAAAAMWKNAAK